MEEKYEELANRFVSSEQLFSNVMEYAEKYRINKGNINKRKMIIEYGELFEIMKSDRVRENGKQDRGFKFNSIKKLKKYFRI